MTIAAGADPALIVVLRLCRARSGLTQEALAFQGQRDDRHPLAYRTRRDRPSLEHRPRHRKALDINLQELGAAVEQEQGHQAKDTEGGRA
jgi:hypothetical protein